jgi:riboflavin kinase/FMN adenylyltransferase
MLHFNALDQVSIKNAWLTIGMFDGVHCGHQDLIRELVSGAHLAGEPAVVITFHPHPSIVLNPSQILFYLTTPDERAEILSKLGVDIVVTQRFDHNLAQISAEDYLTQIKQSTGLSQLWIGHDFALGHNREGNAAKLTLLGQEMGFFVKVLEPTQHSGKIISSSHIRQLLAKGEVAKASELLGRPYALQGEVVPGDQRGRTLGIPTANLSVPVEKLIPASGVYASRAILDHKIFAAAVNIGVRPTFDGRTEHRHIEAHLLNFSGDIYGKQLSIELIAYIRPEQRFINIEALVAQIQDDLNRTHQIILG